MDTNDTYVNQKEAMDILQASNMSIWRWEKQGKFPSRTLKPGHFGHEVFYLRAEIEAFKQHKYEANTNER